MRLIEEYFVLGFSEEEVLKLYRWKPSGERETVRVKEESFPIPIKQYDYVEVFENEDGSKAYQLNEEKQQRELVEVEKDKQAAQEFFDRCTRANKKRKDWTEEEKQRDREEQAVNREARYALEEEMLAEIFHPVDFEQAKKYNPSLHQEPSAQEEKRFDEIVKSFLAGRKKKRFDDLTEEEQESLFQTVGKEILWYLPRREYHKAMLNQEQFKRLKEAEHSTVRRTFLCHSLNSIEKRFVTGDGILTFLAPEGGDA